MAENLIFNVIVKETLERVVQVPADSAETAELMVRRAYRAEEIVLDAADHTDTEIMVTGSQENTEQN